MWEKNCCPAADGTYILFMKLSILHLSDSHICSPHAHLATPSTRFHKVQKYLRHKFTRAVDNLNISRIAEIIPRHSIDHILFTGDLTNSGLQDEFHSGKRQLLGIARKLQSRFSIIPGNHDNLPTENKQNFYTYFHQPRGFFSQTFPEGYCIAGLDTSVYGAGLIKPWHTLEYLTLNSRGAVSAKQLQAMEDTLLSADVRGMYKILLMHHHPLAHYNDRLLKNLALPKVVNSARLLKAIQRAGVHMVLYGHRHPKASCYKVVGHTHFILAPSIRDGQYNRIAISGSRLHLMTESLPKRR